MAADYEAMTMADLVASILAEGFFGDRYREEFARRVRPHNWPDGNPVQTILTRIKEQEPTGNMARLLAVADLAASEHAPYVWPGKGPDAAECTTCMDGSAEPDHAKWPCDPYLNILLALGGAPRPVAGELVCNDLPRREVRGELPPSAAAQLEFPDRPTRSGPDPSGPERRRPAAGSRPGRLAELEGPSGRTPRQ